MEKAKRLFVIEYLAEEIVQQVNGIVRNAQNCNISDLNTAVETFISFMHKEQEYRLKP